MSFESILTILIFPCIGWLLLNSNRNGQRLTRIETHIENLLERKHKNTKHKNTDYEY